jgi:hypothetical protein
MTSKSRTAEASPRTPKASKRRLAEDELDDQRALLKSVCAVMAGAIRGDAFDEAVKMAEEQLKVDRRLNKEKYRKRLAELKKWIRTLKPLC